MASARTKMLKLRLRPREWVAWKEAAKRADKNLSELVREIFGAWVRRAP